MLRGFTRGLRGFTRGLRGFTRGLSWFHTRPFRGFTRAPNKGVNLVFNFLNTLASLRCGDNNSPPEGGGRTPSMRFASCLPAARHSSKHRQRNIQRKNSRWTRRKPNTEQPYRFATCLRHKHPRPRMCQEHAETARQGMARGELRGRVLVGALRL